MDLWLHYSASLSSDALTSTSRLFVDPRPLDPPLESLTVPASVTVARRSVIVFWKAVGSTLSFVVSAMLAVFVPLAPDKPAKAPPPDPTMVWDVLMPVTPFKACSTF